ncbi:MAG TPA: hypothetical protein VND91_03990, partial [Candidatus Saccharimonadia bacterium]|nr:hypothetical protein [Candidatus Saccharimonadia bacterium]
LVVAMCALLFPALGLPLRGLRMIIVALVAAWIPVLLLAWRYELTSQGLRVDRGPGIADPQQARTRQRLDQMTVVVVLAALSLSLLRQFITLHGPTEPAPTAPAVVAPAPAVPLRRSGPIDPHSIAVLPFANLSPAADDAYFSDGLSEELLNVLARIEGLKVTSRTSSFVFRDRTAGVREIGAQLGVANLLEGSVRRQGDDVRISVQLIDAASDRPRWTETYDRQLVDIFRVQEEISQAIADALAQSLGVRQVEVAAATTDLEAYELFLRGRQLFAQRGSNLPAARDLLERAVARDEKFADAWAALAATWYVWRAYAEEPEGVSTLDRSAAAAAKALALEPRHPGALAVSARLAADAGDRLRHASLIAQALELEPSNSNTWLWQGLGLFEVGHLRAAHESFERAQQLDPLSGLQLGWLGITTALAGDRAAAMPMLQRAHALGWRGPASRALFFLSFRADDGSDPTQPFLDWLHDDDGMPAAQRDLARSIAPALTHPDQLPAAQQKLLEASGAAPGLEWATLLQVFGLTDAATAMSMRTELAATQPLLLALWYDPFMDFRQHAQFMQFAERHGLAAYWRERGPPDSCIVLADPAPRLECER